MYLLLFSVFLQLSQRLRSFGFPKQHPSWVEQNLTTCGLLLWAKRRGHRLIGKDAVYRLAFPRLRSCTNITIKEAMGEWQACLKAALCRLTGQDRKIGSGGLWNYWLCSWLCQFFSKTAYFKVSLKACFDDAQSQLALFTFMIFSTAMPFPPNPISTHSLRVWSSSSLKTFFWH